jgi:hypothetical protein
MVKSLSFFILTITSLLLPFASAQANETDSGAEVGKEKRKKKKDQLIKQKFSILQRIHCFNIFKL